MSFKSLREKQFLSQERVAEMTGLSLRTVQRLEAGHRVSYASLRALAVTFRIDVDVLERQLYAAPSTSARAEFVELPRWVRRLRDGVTGGSWLPGRTQAHVFEACAIGLGLACWAAAQFVDAQIARAALLLAAPFSLVVGYGLSVATRIVDAYAGWQVSADPDPTATSRPVPLAHRLGFYLACLLLAAAFLLGVMRLAG